MAFAHIDCNLLTSVSDVLSLLAPRLAPGAVLLFDELAKTTPQQPRHLINFRAAELYRNLKEVWAWDVSLHSPYT